MYFLYILPITVLFGGIIHQHQYMETNSRGVTRALYLCYPLTRVTPLTEDSCLF